PATASRWPRRWLSTMASMGSGSWVLQRARPWSRRLRWAISSRPGPAAAWISTSAPTPLPGTTSWARRRRSRTSGSPTEPEAMTDKIEIENVGQPGKTYRVDAAKFTAMREAVLKVVPDTAPGMTVTDLIAAVKPHLPSDLFPSGEKAGWWVKGVHLDLEAKKVLARTPSPVRLYRTGS